MTVLLISLVAFIHFYLRAGRLALAVHRARAARALDAVRLSLRRHAELPRDPVLAHASSSSATRSRSRSAWRTRGCCSATSASCWCSSSSSTRPLTVWRRGQRGIPLWVGFSVTLFVLLGWATAMLLYWGGWQAPVLVSPFFLGRHRRHGLRHVPRPRQREATRHGAARKRGAGGHRRGRRQRRDVQPRPGARRDRGQRRAGASSSAFRRASG